MKKRIIFLVTVLVACVGYFFLYQDNSYQIFNVSQLEEISREEVVDTYGNEDVEVTVVLTGKVANEEYSAEYTYLESGFYRTKVSVGDQIIVKTFASGYQIIDIRRDYYLFALFIIFILVCLYLGGEKIVKSMLAVIVSSILLILAIIFQKHTKISLIAVFVALLFIYTIITFIFNYGKSKKTLALISSTVISMLVSVVLMVVSMQLLDNKGVRFEELEFVSRAHYTLLVCSVMIGSLGAVMDISVTLVTLIEELLELNPDITNRELLASGNQVGSDIMGTMTSILFFSYITGAIPIIVLYLYNQLALSYSVSMNISLEVLRALTGSIGIVINIPISIACAIFFLSKNKPTCEVNNS